MPVRSQLAAARVRSFAEAGEAYVLRVQGDTRIDAGASRARHLKRNVLRQLSTGDRRHLIYRFAHWFSLSRFAGVEPMDLCFDPPVFARAVYQAFANASRGWITETHELRDPVRPGHRVFLAAVPELCCFGYIASEVLHTVMLQWPNGPTEGDSATYAETLNTELTRAVSALSSETGPSDHHWRALCRLVEALEAIAGTEFDPCRLTDGQVLESWKATAEASGTKRFVELLHQLSVLSTETRLSADEAAAANALSLDDAAIGDRISNAEVLGDSTESIGSALTDPLIEALLSQEDMDVATQQLDKLAGLERLDLSRARLITFEPIENRVIQAKRERRDARDIVCVANPGMSHAMTVAMLAEIIGTLDGFILAAVHMLSKHGRRVDGVRVAVEAGRLSREDVMALVPDLHAIAGEDFNERLETALATVEPVARLAKALEIGRDAWRKLRRRNAFARLGADAPSLDRLESAALHACQLRHALENLHAGVDHAVSPCREGEGFAAEYDTFCGALAHVHGFDFSTRMSR
jgi:hypothetical protein